MVQLQIAAYYTMVYIGAANLAPLMDKIKLILQVLMGIGFIWGTVKVKKGMASLDRGEEGMMGIVSGVGIALAPIITYVLFNAFGYGSMATDISN